MSTIRVNTLQNTSTTDGGISINNSGHVTVDGVAMPSSGPLSNRNLIINGAMQVAQRGTSQTGVSDGSNEGYNTLDRFGLNFSFSPTGTCTVSQDTDVPSNEGFSNSYKIDVTTANASIGSTQRILIEYKIEAQDLRNSGWNYTSTSNDITLSFWAKSSKAGTYCFTARATDVGHKYYVFEYTLAADTWTKVTHSIPGDSSLVFNNDTGNGMELQWVLAAGTDRDDATANQWNAISANNAATSNQVNFFDSTDNDFYLTGVQLEVGSVATPFEHRSYGDELARCQRYYQKMIVEDIKFTCSRWDQSQGVGECNVYLRETMRLAPTFAFTGTWDTGGGWGGNPVMTLARPDVVVLTTTVSTLSASGVKVLRSETTDASISFAAEL